MTDDGIGRRPIKIVLIVAVLVAAMISVAPVLGGGTAQAQQTSSSTSNSSSPHNPLQGLVKNGSTITVPGQWVRGYVDKQSVNKDGQCPTEPGGYEPDS